MLMFQKYNDRVAEKQPQTPELLRLRAGILNEMGSAYAREHNFKRAA